MLRKSSGYSIHSHLILSQMLRTLICIIDFESKAPVLIEIKREDSSMFVLFSLNSKKLVKA